MKYDLVFEPPVMNAAGSLGFAPDSHGPVDLAQLGAFVTNPVSLEARSPAQGAHFIPYHGGFLLHTGHPNPGLKAVLRHYALRWGRSPLPVIVHLLCQKVEEMPGLVRRLEGLPGVMGLELGLPPRVDVQWAVAVVRAAAGELPLIVRLPFERSAELALAILAASNGDGTAAGPPLEKWRASCNFGPPSPSSSYPLGLPRWRRRCAPPSPR